MKYYLSLIVVFIVFSTAHAQNNSASTLKSILLKQFKTTHNVKEWFVPFLTSVQGLTAEQANWKDDKENHSIAQLATHLYFWNKRNLDEFKGKIAEDFNGNNKETFKRVTVETWKTTIQDIDRLFTAWEDAIQNADEEKLREWYSTIANMSTHNAYHTGQILYIRKMKGWWNPKNGVQ